MFLSIQKKGSDYSEPFFSILNQLPKNFYKAEVP